MNELFVKAVPLPLRGEHGASLFFHEAVKNVAVSSSAIQSMQNTYLCLVLKRFDLLSRVADYWLYCCFELLAVHGMCV